MNPLPRTPLRDALAGHAALAAARGVLAIARVAGRGALATARWCVPSLARPGRTTASGITIAVVLAVVTGDLTIPLLIAAIWLTVAWAGRRMSTRAIRAGRMPVAALRVSTRAATRSARRQIEKGLR